MCSYKDKWAAAVGELLKFSIEPTNVSARYAVDVIKEGLTISHLPSTEENFRTGLIFE